MATHLVFGTITVKGKYLPRITFAYGTFQIGLSFENNGEFADFQFVLASLFNASFANYNSVTDGIQITMNLQSTNPDTVTNDQVRVVFKKTQQRGQPYDIGQGIFRYSDIEALLNMVPLPRA